MEAIVGEKLDWLYRRFDACSEFPPQKEEKTKLPFSSPSPFPTDAYKTSIQSLAEATGVELPSEVVFTHPTAALIADYINSLKLGRSKEREDRAASIAG